jgi:hypothetical protein
MLANETLHHDDHAIRAPARPPPLRARAGRILSRARSAPPATGSCSHGPVGCLVGAVRRNILRARDVRRRGGRGGKLDESGVDGLVHSPIPAPLLTTPT